MSRPIPCMAGHVQIHGPVPARTRFNLTGGMETPNIPLPLKFSAAATELTACP